MTPPKDTSELVARLRLCGVRLGGESQDEAAMRRNATIAQAADELVNAYRIIGETREALAHARLVLEAHALRHGEKFHDGIIDAALNTIPLSE